MAELDSIHFERQEGVHFLTDLYLVLGVERDADSEAIRTAYLQKAMQYHPDRYQGLAPEMKSKAEFQMRVLNRANDTLGNQKARELYDGVLASWEGPISEDGRPVIELTRMFYGAESSPQAQRFAEMMAEIGVGQIGFDEKMLEMAERIYESTDHGEDAARLLDEQLRKKQLVINHREASLRSILGIEYSDQEYPSSDYLLESQEAVERGRNKIVAREEKSKVLLEGGIMHLLTTGNVDADGQEMHVTLGNSTATYNERADEVLRLAKENVDIIEQRLRLVRGTYIGEQENAFDKIILQVTMNGQVIRMAFERRDTSMNKIELSEDVLAQAFTEEGAKKVYEEGFNVIAVTVPEGLPWLSVMEQVVTDHYSFGDKEEIESK